MTNHSIRIALLTASTLAIWPAFAAALNKHVKTPELKEQRNQTMLFVFGL